MSHIPVLFNEVIEHARDIAAQNMLFVDGTFGRGGHLRGILGARPDLEFLALDCDAEAITYAEQNFASEISSGRMHIARANFSDIKKVLEQSEFQNKKVAGILLDLGVSSPQLDQGPRGFSFYHDGPLDMRMDQSKDFTASDIVNTWSEDDINELFKKYGEVSRPYRVTEKILVERKLKKFSRTSELSTLIEKTDGWRKKGHHPATNYFLALRLVVNQELERLEKVLPELVQVLAPNGRLLVITFHSLEDRLVKQALKAFAASGLGRLVNKKAIQASWQQKKENPRARSAILRVFEKGSS